MATAEALLGQTHLLPPGWPLLTVSANRPLTVALALSGTGSAPPVTATVTSGGEVHTLCLNGPLTLPADASAPEISTYRATLPSAWVVPGVSIELSYGGDPLLLEPEVAPENGLTLYVVDAELFGEGSNEATSDAQWQEFLARLPFSFLDVGQNPFGVWQPSRLVVGARSDGRTPTGETTSHEAIVIDENPHCTSEDQSASACTLHSGYGTMGAVLSHLDSFRAANGALRSSTWYADLGVELGGGLAGGQRGTGDDLNLVMNHELGHAWGFPHWDTDDTEYPYEGVQRNRGGFGDYPALDQQTGLLLPTTCEGLERQSPMQRAGSCVPAGSWYDPFSDYESARLLRMNLGAAEEIVESVPYSGGVLPASEREFTLRAEDGRLAMVWNEDGPGFSFELMNEENWSYEAWTDESTERLVASEVEVTMFSGGVIFGGDGYIEEPIEYVGNLLYPLDPTTTEGLAELVSRHWDDYYWAHDTHFRITLEDGTVLSRVYQGGGSLRSPGDVARFALNLPREIGDQVTRFEVLSRPLGYYEPASRVDESVTPETYFAAAEVLLTWER